MKRAVLIVLDSVGIGGAADAAEFGDAGADTIGHIAAACADGRGDREGLRQRAAPPSKPRPPRPRPRRGGLDRRAGARSRLGGEPAGRWGYGVERSQGKDTPSGHWEIAGVPVPFAWGYFPRRYPHFPLRLPTS